MENKRYYSKEEVLNEDPFVLADYVATEYMLKVPEMNTIEEMELANHLLGYLTNERTYILSLIVVVKAYVRMLKEDKTQKEAYNKMKSRQESLDDALKMIDGQYAAISRKISTKAEINKEISFV